MAPRTRCGAKNDLADTLRLALADPANAPPWLNVGEDGWFYFTQSEAAFALGVTKPTIGRRIAALEQRNLIASKATNAGTAVKLLHSEKAVA